MNGKLSWFTIVYIFAKIYCFSAGKGLFNQEK